jgi:DNA-directed RNA polymerase subunit RPC12/RpoP
MELGEIHMRKPVDILKELWDKEHGRGLLCPQCKRSLTIIQMNPVDKYDTLYVPYHTIIECPYCSFRLETESYTILGSITNFDAHTIEITGWSPSGSRVVSQYEHMLDYRILKQLKDSTELVEFLIVDNQAVQIIG